MSRRVHLLLGLLLVVSLVPTVPGLAATTTDYSQVVDLTFPFAEGTDVHWPDTYDASRGGGRHHQATDLMAPYGTPVYAAVGGTVTRAGDYGWGYVVKIDGTDGRSYVYLHLGHDDRPRSEAIADGIREGTQVSRGQLLGYVGCSGSAVCDPRPFVGDHLHFEIHDDAVVDPYDYHKHERLNPWPSLKAAVDRGDYGVTRVFTDVVPHSTHWSDILALADAQITRGCGDRQFCPGDGVTRAEMASFLVRAMGLAPAEGGFTDVPQGSRHAQDIATLAANGITKGCNPPANDRFCPGGTVTRAQMASFLVRGFVD